MKISPESAVWALIWSCPFISPQSFPVEEVPNLGMYHITSLFVTLHYVRKLCPGLHCAGKLYPHILERVSRDKWRTGQVFISSGCFTWEHSDSCHALSCIQPGAQGGRGDRSPCAHTQALEVSICVHSTEQQAGINLARALISPVIRAINHSIQNMQEKWQRALKMGDVILPACPEVEKPVL